MNIHRTITALALSTMLSAVAGAPALAEEPEHNLPPVCDADQVLPGFGFLPVTFSQFVVALLGGDPDECQTPVE